jgi:hypothetical protein
MRVVKCPRDFRLSFQALNAANRSGAQVSPPRQR